jgi:HK97 family phage major capsid protein
MANDIARADVPIPDQYINEVVSVATQKSAVMQLMRTVPMARGTATMPVTSLLATASWVNPTDTGQKATSYMEWTGLHLTAEELAVIVPIYENVLDDATFDIAGEAQDSIAEALAAAIDQAVLFGTGAPASFPAGGVYGVAVGAGNDLIRGSIAGQDVAEDINQVLGMVEDDGYDPNGFVMRRGMRGKLRGLRDSVGSPIFAPGSGGKPGLQLQQLDGVYGLPTTYTNLGFIGTAAVADANDPSADVFAGDWSMAILGIRRDVTFKIFTEGIVQNPDGTIAINLMQNDAIAIRCVMRCGVAIARPASRQSLAPSSAQQAPFAVLKPVGSS